MDVVPKKQQYQFYKVPTRFSLEIRPQISSF